MAGLSFIKAKPISVDATRSTSLRGVPMQDKLMALGSILQGDTGALQQLQLLAAARQQQAEQSAAEKDLADFMSQKGVPRRPAAAPSFDPMTEGGPTTPGAGISAIPRVQLPERAPQADAIGGPVSMRSAIPMLAEAMRRKVPLATVKEYREQIQGAEPKYSYTNGVRADERDPNAPSFIPTFDKGEEPLYDGNGRIVAVRNIDGSISAKAAAAGAVTDAQERAKAGLDIVRLPLDNGSEEPMTRLDAAARLSGVPRKGVAPASPAPAGPPAGVPRLPGSPGYRTQTPADKVLAEERARAQSGREAAAPKAFSGLEAQGRASDIVLDNLTRALPMIGGWTAGVGGVTRFIPGTPGKDLASMFDTIRANIGFDKLAEMRANSPTGGALGNVSEKENALLQSVLGSLDQNQSPEQLARQTQDLIKQLTAIREERKAAYGRQYSDASSTAGTTGSTKAPPAQRQVGKVYQTPKGPMKWTGTGWLPQ